MELNKGMRKAILITGAMAGLLAVLLGAFGAHGLKQLVAAEAVASFETGVRYQMYHAIMCIVIGGLSFLTEKQQRQIFYLFLIGTILFSGSIYLLVLDEVMGVSLSGIAFVTPMGGLFLIVGWVRMLVAFMRAAK